MSARRTGKNGVAGKTGKARIVRMTLEEALRTSGRTDWARFDALTDAEIEADIADDPDAAPILDAEWFKRATLMANGVFTAPAPKQAVSIRLDRDIVDWFKTQGPRYQSRMNAVLRAYVSGRRAAGRRK